MMEHRSSFWLDRPTLVTGATGLVGRFVVRRLLGEHASVVCLVRDLVPQSALLRSPLAVNESDPFFSRVNVVRGELEDLLLLERILNEYEVTTVLHLGAQALVPVANRNPLSTFESNVRGTWCLLEACRRSPLVRHIVVASSDKAYGEQEMLPYTENMSLLARHPYDVSKACMDMIAQSYARSFGLPVAIARCGNFFGEGDLNWSRVVPGTIRSLLRGERPVIRSDGAPLRDYFYADDGAFAYLLLAEKLAEKPELAGEAFNFSSEEPLTVLGIVSRILSLMGSNVQPDIRNVSRNEILRQHLSAEKARSILGWRPRHTLEEGLRHTIAWYRSFLVEPS